MSQRENQMVLRLAARGKEELLGFFRSLGKEGRESASKIEQGFKKATPALQGVNSLAKKTKSSLQDLSRQGGAVGEVLEDMGGAGLVAGAAIGGVTLALSGALKVAREAVVAFDAVGKSAASLDITTDTLQSLVAVAADEGVEFSNVEGALRSLNKAHSDLILGTGELYSRLKDTNPQLLEMLRNTRDNDERLRILTDALRGNTDEVQRANIAYAAFGESGADFARILAKQEDGIDGMIGRARALGLVIEEDVIRNAEEMNGKMDLASRVVDLQMKQAFIDLAPVLIDSASLIADISRELVGFLNLFREAEDISTSGLEQKFEKVKARLIEVGVSQEDINRAIETGNALQSDALDNMSRWGTKAVVAEAAQAEFNRLNAELSVRTERETRAKVSQIRRRATTEDLKEERSAQLALIKSIEEDQRAAASNPDAKLNLLTVADWAKQTEFAKQQIAEIDAELARRKPVGSSRDPTKEAELNRLRAEAIKLQKELGDYTAYVAEQEAKYARMHELGLITDDQYAAVKQRLRDEVNGVSDAVERWAGLVSSTLTPVESISRKIIDLKSDFAAGRVEVDLYKEAYARLKKELADAKADEKTKLPGFGDAEKIRADLEAAARDAMTPLEKLRAEQERLAALVREGPLDGEDATAWLEVYAERLREAARENGLLGQAEKLLDGIQAGRIRTLDDLGRAFSAMLIDMVRNYLAAQQQMKGGGGSFLDFVFGTGNFGTGDGGGLLSSIGSFFGGGSGPAAPAASAVHIVGQSHSGGSGRSPATQRSLASGIYPGERLQVVEDTETILTASGRMDIAGQIAAMASERVQMAGLVNRALRGAGAGQSAGDGLKVNINNYGGADVSAERSQGADGPELNIDIKKGLQDAVRGGALDGVMKERFGLRAAGA